MAKIDVRTIVYPKTMAIRRQMMCAKALNAKRRLEGSGPISDLSLSNTLAHSANNGTPTIKTNQQWRIRLPMPFGNRRARLGVFATS